LLIDSAEEGRQFSTALPREGWWIDYGELGGAVAYSAATPNREERMTETFAAAANRRDCEDDRNLSGLSNAIRGLT
jgi:hypothetical protein